MARYRAIEEGLPLARAASGGISAIVDGYGRIVRAVQSDREGAATEAQLPPSLQQTPYANSGMWLLLALVFVITALRFAPGLGAGRGLKT
jgi:apolipoprotein N-acyltransferase